MDDNVAKTMLAGLGGLVWFVILAAFAGALIAAFFAPIVWMFRAMGV